MFGDVLSFLPKEGDPPAPTHPPPDCIEVMSHQRIATAIQKVEADQVMEAAMFVKNGGEEATEEDGKQKGNSRGDLALKRSAVADKLTMLCTKVVRRILE